LTALLEYKCPCCGGAIEFDAGSQNLKCPYCDTEFDIDTLKSYGTVLEKDREDSFDWSKSKGSEWTEDETLGMIVYSCKSCGGEIIGDNTTAATSCPFCGNPVVLTGQLSGALKPDLVLPFKLDKNAAKEGLMRHISKKPLLPKVFKDQNHIDEIKGIYVPFWLFDADVKASVRFKATRLRSWSDMKYNYTETQYYSVVRGGSVSFENVPADGSTKMPDDLMQSIEPFDISSAVDFKTAYLAGFFADKYDVSADDCIEIANDRIKKSTSDAFADTVDGYASVTPESSTINLTGKGTRYALLPVWILNTTWNGNKYTFAMNGQTGKFVGNLPIDKKAALRWAISLTPVCTVAVYLISLLLRAMGLI